MENLENMNLVSIIMPAYNVEKYIEDSIKSVINQTYKFWELIIIDDGSTDSTAKVCKKYTKLDERIRYIYQDNARQAIARNTGISHCKGRILAFLDSDDIWLPEKLEISLRAFEGEKVDLIFTNTYSSEKVSLNVLGFDSMKVVEKIYSGNSGLKEFIHRNKIPMLTVLVKKKIVVDIGLFDSNCVPAEDYDLWLRLLKKGYTFKGLNKPLAVYRVHNESSSGKDRLVIDKVLYSFMKNFGSNEFEKLNVRTYTNFWMKRWIKIYLAKDNFDQLRTYFKYFKYSHINFLFLVQKLLSLSNFKKVALKLIK